MIRLYEPVPLVVGESIELSEHAKHYLLTVLRLRLQDELILFNGEGGEYHATITHLSKKQLQVTINHFQDKDLESPLQIHLAQSLPKGDKLDYITQKAVELGVASITPIIAERSQGRLSKEQAQKKRARLQEIAIAACEQCGRNLVPVIHPPATLTDWLSSTDHASFRYILTPHETSVQLGETRPPGPVYFLIGPEGGFTESEYSKAKEHGLLPFSMGKRVLRTETASLAAVCILQWCWGDM